MEQFRFDALEASKFLEEAWLNVELPKDGKISYTQGLQEIADENDGWIDFWRFEPVLEFGSLEIDHGADFRMNQKPVTEKKSLDAAPAA